MLITGQQIIEGQLLGGADESRILSGSYYLRIHSIIPAGDAAASYKVEEPLTAYTLKPGGLAWIISEEVFKITDYGVTALVTLRSTFTKKGLLALDVGLVDANYEGPIGTVVINFSKNDVRLSNQDEFFRVIFFRHDEVEDKFRFPKKTFTHDQYISERLDSLTSDFPETFLEIGQIGDIEKLVEGKVKELLKEQETLEPLRDDLLDKVLRQALWKYKFWIAAIILSLGVGGFVLFQQFGPQYTAEDIRELVQRAIESRVGGEQTDD